MPLFIIYSLFLCVTVNQNAFDRPINAMIMGLINFPIEMFIVWMELAANIAIYFKISNIERMGRITEFRSNVMMMVTF